MSRTTNHSSSHSSTEHVNSHQHEQQAVQSPYATCLDCEDCSSAASASASGNSSSVSTPPTPRTITVTSCCGTVGTVDKQSAPARLPVTPPSPPPSYRTLSRDSLAGGSLRSVASKLPLKQGPAVAPAKVSKLSSSNKEVPLPILPHPPAEESRLHAAKAVIHKVVTYVSPPSSISIVHVSVYCLHSLARNRTVCPLSCCVYK